MDMEDFGLFDFDEVDAVGVTEAAVTNAFSSRLPNAREEAVDSPKPKKSTAGSAGACSSVAASLSSTFVAVAFPFPVGDGMKAVLDPEEAVFSAPLRTEVPMATPPFELFGLNAVVPLADATGASFFGLGNIAAKPVRPAPELVAPSFSRFFAGPSSLYPGASKPVPALDVDALGMGKSSTMRSGPLSFFLSAAFGATAATGAASAELLLAVMAIGGGSCKP